MKTFSQLKVVAGLSNFYLRDVKTGDYVMKSGSDTREDADTVTEVVHACNCHDELLAALGEMLEQFGHYCEGTEDPAEIAAQEQARAALNKAKGNT